MLDSELLLIANHYGAESQLDQLTEEMAELIVAINHFKRFRKTDNAGIAAENLLEEIADVDLVLSQVKHLLGCRYEVERIKEQKIQRQLERIAKEKEHGV